MKRRIPFLVIVALALGGYGVYRLRQARAPFEWSGTVEARTIEIGSRVGGRVEQVHVREGDMVAAGQAIVTLEKGDLPAQRLIAEGQLTQAEGALEKLSGALPSARRAQIAEAQARLQAQRATQAKAKQDEERMRKLYTGGAATRVDADNATLGLRSADAQVAALRAQVDTLLQGTPQDVKSAQGMVDAARGRLQQIDVMLAELVIRAPRAARVESLDLRPGDIIAPNAPAATLLEAASSTCASTSPRRRSATSGPGCRCRSRSTRSRTARSTGAVEISRQPGRVHAAQPADRRRARRPGVRDARRGSTRARDVLRAGMAALVHVAR